MHLRTLTFIPVVVATGVTASHAQASLVGTPLTATITHSGVAGGLVGQAIVPHTYGGAPSIFANQFLGTFLLASPAPAPGYDNALLIDFSLFNYSGFVGGNTGTISITGLSESVAPGSIAIFAGTVGSGLNIATAVSNGANSFNASWSPDLIFTPSPTAPDAMVVAWNSVPAPGALALLGLAGLVGARRRRN